MRITREVRVAAGLVLAALLMVPGTAQGQEVAVPVVVEVAPSAPVVSANGPVVVQAGVRLPSLESYAVDVEALEARQGPRQRRNIRWMVVGGVMLVGGAIVGGDAGTIVSVGGLVIGGVGLYRYLQ